MMPTAISQVVEQVVRVAVILFVASLFGSNLFQTNTSMGTWRCFMRRIMAVLSDSCDVVLCIERNEKIRSTA